MLLFAKSLEAKHTLQSQWEETKKTYLAVVHGRCEKKSETLSTYLVENKARGVFSTPPLIQGEIVPYRVHRAQGDKRLHFTGS